MFTAVPVDSLYLRHQHSAQYTAHNTREGTVGETKH